MTDECQGQAQRANSLLNRYQRIGASTIPPSDYTPIFDHTMKMSLLTTSTNPPEELS